MDLETLRSFATALGIGLLVGMEREWSQREARTAAGSRTFALLALAGATSALLGELFVVAALLGVVTLAALSYWRLSQSDVGLTTEVAALLTFLLGALSWTQPGLAAAIAVTATVLLAFRVPLHQLAREVITETEVQDALKFLVLALVVLPFVPNQAIDQWGALNPWRIWLLVVMITGIGWAGYVLVRILGTRNGLMAAGFAGGFVSASAATAAMGRTARGSKETLSQAIAGSLMASAATLVQLGIVVGVTSQEMLMRLLPAIIGGTIVITAMVALIVRGAFGKKSHSDASPWQLGRPFSFWPAMTLAALLSAVVFISRWATESLGTAGAAATAGLAGFADAHAAVLGVVTVEQTGGMDVRTAMLAAGLALATNTVTKCILAFVSGGRAFGTRFTGLIAIPAAAVALLLALRLG
jgi:uncharacterized membrane protein (DUF4010 family)